jgi:hypothetical protein
MTGNPILFAEDINEGFDGSALDSEWTWNANSSIKYSLTEKKGFLSIDIPNDQPYDIWSNDVHDGMLLLRHDQGNRDWAIETLIEIHSSGHGYQTGLVVWSNPYVMYFWGVKCQKGKHHITYSAEQMGISDNYSSKNSIDVEDDWVTLRIEKFGKKLLLQYWNEDDDSFVTYQTVNFKFPVNGIGLMARTFITSENELRIAVDYFKLIK